MNISEYVLEHLRVFLYLHTVVRKYSWQ